MSSNPTDYNVYPTPRPICRWEYLPEQLDLLACWMIRGCRETINSQGTGPQARRQEVRWLLSTGIDWMTRMGINLGIIQACRCWCEVWRKRGYEQRN